MRAINLIPAEQRRGAGGVAGRTGGVVYVIIGGLVAVVAVGVIYVSAVHQVATRQTALAKVTAQDALIKGDIGALQEFIAFDSLSEQRVSDVVALAVQRFNWPLAMQQLALALPSNVTLTSLTGSATAPVSSTAVTTGTTGTTVATTATGSSGTTSTSANSVTAPTLSMSGCAPGTGRSVGTDAQDEVADVLARMRQLRGVTNATLSTYAKGGCSGVDFNMTVTYGNDYGIISPTLHAGANTTVGG